MVDQKLLELLVCPVTKSKLIFRVQQNELWSVAARLAYPIRRDIPVMIEDEARKLSQEELDSIVD